MSESRPTHIVDREGDTCTHCGLSLRDASALPYVGRRFVRAHREGRERAQRSPLEFCAACEPDGET